MAQLAAEPRVADEEVRSQVLSFLRSLHGDRSGTISLKSGFRVGRDLKGTHDIEFQWPAQADDLVVWITKEASYGRDVYHRVAMKHSGDTQTRLGALFVDIDCESLFGLPEPTIVVRTSPGRGQCYWVLDEPIELRQGERMCRRLFLASGATVAELHDIPLMRLPGLPNFKYPDVTIAVSSVGVATYDAADLARYLPESPSALQRLESRLAAGRLAWSGLLRARVVAAGAAAMSLLAFMSGEAGMSQNIGSPISLPPDQPAVQAPHPANEIAESSTRSPIAETEEAPLIEVALNTPVSDGGDAAPEAPAQVREDDPLSDTSDHLGAGVRTFWSRTSEGLASVQGQQEER